MHKIKLYCYISDGKPVLDRVETGLDQDRSETAKNRHRPVYIGSVRSFSVLEAKETGLGLGLWLWGVKDRTGPDFQTLPTKIWLDNA